MKKNPSQEVNANSDTTLNISQGLANIRQCNSGDIIFKINHDCSQSGCHAYDSTSTDSDVEKRIRIKATRFSKAYPKRSFPNKLTSSKNPLLDQADGGEEILTERRLIVCSSEGLSSSNSNKEEINTRYLESMCHHDHVTQSKCLNSNYAHMNKSVEEHLKHFIDVCQTHSSNKIQSQNSEVCSYSNCVEIFSSSDTCDSEESISELSEDPLRFDYQNRQLCTKTEPSIKKSEGPGNGKTNTNYEISPLKAARPFRYYPEDPLALTIGFDTAKVTINGGRPENYDEFRGRMLGSKHLNKSSINKNMRRLHSSYTSNNSYREKRNKNNMAAKRSRDARRAKEDELAIRCAYLEQENMFLKRKVARMEEERKMLKM